MINVHVGGLATFGFGIARAIGRADLLNVLTKAAIPPLVWSAISCVQGLAVGEEVGDITPVMNRSLRRSVVSLFIIITTVSVLTYA
jgi:ABC-type transporter Mla maintaining outer membrane lipid asymmetry permease subunit MlaE